MSVTIPESYIEQFSVNVHMLAEQRMSRLRRTVQILQVTGESAAIERIGETLDAANEITDQHGDTPLNNTAHSRRWLFIKDFDVADLIDRQDRVRLLIDPDSRYTVRHAGVMGRTVDDTIITALEGNATEGKNQGTTVALPAAQKVGASSTGMTVSKLLQAKEILDAAEVDEFVPRFAVMSAKQVTNLLNDDKLTSSDFNTVRALVAGQINEYLGFTFIRSERLTKSGNDRLCYTYAGDAITLGVAHVPTSIAAERPDKRHAKQIYTYGSWGAVRVEDERVVQISADAS